MDRDILKSAAFRQGTDVKFGFPFKQRQNATICELNLQGFEQELAVLSGTAASVELSTRAIAQAGENPDHWLPIFDQMRKTQ
jgi:type IV secretion system protein VirB4